MKRTALILALLLVPLAAQAQHARQRAIPHYLAQYSGCGALNEDDLFVIVDASSRVDCDTTPEAVPANRIAAYCVCDGGVARPAGIDPVSAATTAAAGIVELATDGENAASVVVQGNDSRINGAPAPPRTVYVRSGATPITGKVYSTIKDAVDYVASQGPQDVARWQVRVQGGTTYTEDPFTIPAWTDLVCDWGGYIYTAFELGGTVINNSLGSALSGDFITMSGNSAIRGCVVYARGNSTGVRNAINCTASNGSSMCDLDHVGVMVDESGASTQANVAVNASSGGGGLLSLYYVVFSALGGNTNAVMLNIGASNALNYSNGIVGTSGNSFATGINSASNSPFYSWVHNVRIGSPYSAGNFTTDIVEGGSGAFYVTDVDYSSSSGTITRLDRSPQAGAAAALPTCDAQRLGVIMIDTSNSNELCKCDGAGPAWNAVDGSGTCD